MKERTTSIISRWGNSLAIRLPKALLDEARLREGATVTVEAMPDGAIILEPARPTLEELLASITPDTLYGEEWNDAPVGNEFW